MRKILYFTYSFLIILILLGCSKNDDVQVNSNQIKQEKLKAAIVTDVGGIGDESFNSMAWQGLQKANKELGIDIKFIESREQADYIVNLRKLAQQGNNLVFAVGYLMEDAVKQVSVEFPNVSFVIIDGNAPKSDNTASLKFYDEQGSFLAGALAGAMTKTSKIGFIGGVRIPLIEKFEFGYKAGAMSVNPEIKVFSAFCGKFDDPGKGKELALSQFSQGADIIFHAAGGSGRGVIDAAKDKGNGFYAIGVDSDQDHLAKGRVLSSMMKRVDNAVFMTCKDVKNKSFKPGDHYFGVNNDGLALSPMKYTKQDVPPEVLVKIEKIKQMIIDGKIIVPKTENELKLFLIPTIK